MTNVDIFKEVMSKAKSCGYKGPDYDYKLGFIVDDTNFYSVIFREDFAKAIWGENYLNHIGCMVISENKWKYLEKNALN